MVIVALVALVGPSNVGWSEAPKTKTVITSDKLTASNESNQAVFQGSVKMVKDDMVVRSDMMIVYFKDKQPRKSQAGSTQENSAKEIKLIEAKGRVRIAKGESRAVAKHALYFKDEEKVILKGSPVAWQGGTRISGPKMTMFLKENRSVVEGGTKVIIEQPPE